ncbi:MULTISPECIES: Cro/CI family transcriptional regulator [unclassified Achromobacter]|uniref:Cro/CI family transcriptional regulator n=1 Tax=unclassified Achromobacter TaxID=2626865 RepID=UPI000B51BC63|nr:MULTISPECIES: Cro/CI family transcriptional regulator [unclassified Achromobacter]OWT68066.1 hypothetical protein CEY05_28960 [Achromobacter sp. HZ34]OWT69903.1 hypothetical protein CEY04_27790 [Achromobacter sp. HZ28]
MTKQEAIAKFGNGAALARALGITRSAISQWPDVLDQTRTDLVNGAAMRLGKIKVRRKRAARVVAAEAV